VLEVRFRLNEHVQHYMTMVQISMINNHKGDNEYHHVLLVTQ